MLARIRRRSADARVERQALVGQEMLELLCALANCDSIPHTKKVSFFLSFSPS